MSKFLRSHLLFIGIITFVAVVITRHIWGTRGWIETHDGIFHVIRLEEMTKMIRLGHFPTRWAGDLDNGFGIPLFNYVYPGPYYLGIPLMLLGVPSKWVIKVLLCALYLTGALGVYAIFADKNKKLATAASLFYLTTPYLLVNIFVRGAIGELAAMSLIPWVVWAWKDIGKKGKMLWYHPLPYFLLFISHNFLSFIFLPVYILLALTDRQSIKRTFLALLFSVGLAGFFLLPLILERSFLSSVAEGNFTYPYYDHFVYPFQLIYSKWGNGPSISGPNDGFSFELGFPHLAVLLLGLYLAIKRPSKNKTLWLVVTFGCIFFLLSISNFIWKIVTPLAIMQFPWRFLSITTVSISLLAYYVLKDLKKWEYYAIPGILVGFIFAYIYSIPPYTQNNAQFADQIYVHQDQTTTASREELLPRWVTGGVKWRGDEQVRISSGDANLQVISSTPLSITISSDTSTSATYLIRRNYFPSWQASDENGKKMKLTPSEEGEISLTPETGHHTYNIHIGNTTVENVANWLSILSLGLLITATLRKKK